MGTDARRLSAICQRPDRTLRLPGCLSALGLDERAARSGRLTVPALVPCRHDAPTRPRHGRRDRHSSPDELAKLKDHLAKAARTAIDANNRDDNPYADRGG